MPVLHVDIGVASAGCDVEVLEPAFIPAGSFPGRAVGVRSIVLVNALQARLVDAEVADIRGVRRSELEPAEYGRQVGELVVVARDVVAVIDPDRIVPAVKSYTTVRETEGSVRQRVVHRVDVLT